MASTTDSISLGSDPSASEELTGNLQDALAIDKSKGVEELLLNIAKLFQDKLESSLVTIWDHNPLANCLVLQASQPPRRGSQSAHTISISESRTGIAAQTGKITIIPDLRDDTDARIFENPEVLGDLDLNWMISIPVFDMFDTKKSVANLVINVCYSHGQSRNFVLSRKHIRRISRSVAMRICLAVAQEDEDIREVVQQASVLATGSNGLLKSVFPEISRRCRCTFIDIHTASQGDSKLERETAVGKMENEVDDPRTGDLRDISCIMNSVISRNEPIMLTTTRSELAATEFKERIQCMAMALPLRSRSGRPFGLVRAFDPDPMVGFVPSFSSLDLHRFETFADFLAGPIERFVRYRAEQALLSAMNDLIDAGEEENELEGFLQRALEALARSIQIEVGSIYLREPGQDFLTMRAAYGPGEVLVGKARYTIGEGLTGWIASKNELVIIDSLQDLKAHPSYEGVYDDKIWADGREFRNFIGVPLRVGSVTRGVLKLANRSSSPLHPEDYFTDEDREHVSIFAAFIGYAIHREHMLEGYRLLATASVDSLAAEDEDDGIYTVLAALESAGFANVLLALCDGHGKSLRIHLQTGAWEAYNFKAERSLEADDPLVKALSELEACLLEGDEFDNVEHFNKVLIVPLRTTNEVLGVLLVGVQEESVLDSASMLLIRAFGAHLGVTIAAARIRRRLVSHTESTVSSARFIVAEALSAHAIHSLHHDTNKLINEISQRLEDPEVRQNRFVLKELQGVKTELRRFEENAAKVLEIVRTPGEIEGSVNVNNALQPVVDRWYSMIASNRCKVELIKESKRAWVQIPSYALEEILSVLIVNSIQAHARNIKIRTFDEDAVTTSGESGCTIEKAVCIDVKDNGVGLTVENSDDIFAADYTSKPEKFGTGLGLFIARRLAKENGGDLFVVEDTKQSKGVTFRLVLFAEED